MEDDSLNNGADEHKHSDGESLISARLLVTEAFSRVLKVGDVG